MRLSRRMRLKPLGETPDEELTWAGEEGVTATPGRWERGDSRMRWALTGHVGR